MSLINREALIAEYDRVHVGTSGGARKLMVDAPEVKSEQKWIPVSERLPECEQEVLICTMEKVYVSKKTGMEWHKESVITPAFYEDGSMLEVNSKWRWENIDYAGWDEEEDCGIIPEGWWENRHFNPDEVYNNPVDQKVVAWMPLPEPYWEEVRTDETDDIFK